MIKIVFKNLEKSELAREAVKERFESIFDKFPNLKKSRMKVTLEMQNSPLQAGPDVFSVKVQCRLGRGKGIRLEKSAQSLYVALADVVEHMQELLNRSGDRVRSKARKSERKHVARWNMRWAKLAVGGHM